MSCGADYRSANLSEWVFPAADGRLLYQPDGRGNRIPDFSGVGYWGGTVPIPDVQVVETLSPIAGDNTKHIQEAINRLKTKPLGTNGFRGALLLRAGEYSVSGTITIDGSGIVLRGEGDGLSGTILRASGTGQRSLIHVTGAGSPIMVSNNVKTITDRYVPVGTRSFHVENTAGFSKGDRIFVRRTATDQWIEDIGMNLLDNPWRSEIYHLDFDRIITRIEGDLITVDAPVVCAIEADYAGGTITKYSWPGRIRNVGVENIRGVSDFNPSVILKVYGESYFADEDHAWIFIETGAVENGWVRRVTSQHFGYSCVSLDSGTRAFTVEDSRALDPVSEITGSRRYAFVLNNSQLSLIKNCYTEKDRHQFVTHARTMGPNVFVDCLSDTAYADAGPHHRWAAGAIWDNVTVNGNSLNVRNRGNAGTGHGWAGVNMVVWNSCALDYTVQNPPGARNWLIGSSGTITERSGWIGPHDPGTYDSHDTNVFPNSLYYAQLQDRLAAPGSETREYWLGDIDGFQPDGPAGDPVPVDSGWLAEISAAAGPDAIRGFDRVAQNQWVPFTFNFQLAPSEEIKGASLALALRFAEGSNTGTVYIGSTNNGISLFGPPVESGTNVTVRILDLSDQLPLLAGGKLNVSLKGNIGIDWAMLEFHSALPLVTDNRTVEPSADTFVRGGVYADDNYGNDTRLRIKKGSSADFCRQAYLKWDLSGIEGRVIHARVRLVPVSVGTVGLEHAVSEASGSWEESSVTWNGSPYAGKRISTWIAEEGNPVEFSVTPWVQAALDRDRTFSLQMFSLTDAGGEGLVAYGSREEPEAELRPQLILSIERGPDVRIWTGGGTDDKWTTAGNWTGGTAPSFGENQVLEFYAEGTSKSVMGLGDPLGNTAVVRGLNFRDQVDSDISVGLLSTGSGGPGRILVFQAPFGQDAMISVSSGVTGNIMIGSSTDGGLTINSDIVISHNGSGKLLFGRRILEGVAGRSLTKTGTGALQMFSPGWGAGSASFKGGLNINGGSVIFKSDGNLGDSTGGVNLDGGLLMLASGSGSVDSARAFTFKASGGTLNIEAGNVLTLSSGLEGTGDLIKEGNGILALGGPDNRVAGNTEIASGALRVNQINRIHSSSNLRIGDGATFETVRSSGDQGMGSRTVTIDGDSTIVVGRSNLTLKQVNGAGKLIVKTVGGTLILSSSGSYEGGTLISTGTVIGDAENAFGNGGVTVADGAALTLRRSDLICDQAELILGKTSTLSLDFTGNEIVRFLSLNSGVSWLAAGVYDAAALSAFNESGSYSGSGSVEVLASVEVPVFNCFRMSPGGILISGFGGMSGCSYRIFATEDLNHTWVEVCSGSFTGDGFEFFDPQATNYSRRFYRMISP